VSALGAQDRDAPDTSSIHSCLGDTKHEQCRSSYSQETAVFDKGEGTCHKAYLIPPETAKVILETYNIRLKDCDEDSDDPSNRALKAHVVERYAADMRNEDWQLTHQGISFDTRQLMGDGQHRCEACVKADTSFQSLVTFGQSPDARQVVDQGTVRTAGDALQMDPDVSYKTPGKCKYLASIIQAVRHLGHGRRVHRSRQSTMGVINTYKADRKMFDKVMDLCYCTSDAKIYMTPELGAAVYRALRGTKEGNPVSVESVQAFCESIKAGDESHGASTWTKLIGVQKLNEVLPTSKPFFRDPTGKSGAFRTEEVPRQLLLAAEKAIVAFHEGEQSKAITPKTDFLSLKFLKQLKSEGIFFLDCEVADEEED